MLPPFKNEPMTNFTDPANKAAFEQALALVESRFGEKIPLIVGGERIFTNDTIKSTNPANPEQVLAYVGKGTQELALKAVEVPTKHSRHGSSSIPMPAPASSSGPPPFCADASTSSVPRW